MPENIKLLILARTNPNISDTYVETVCTAGITPEGQWIRLYPLPVRLHKRNLGRKYEWITCQVQVNETWKDARPESRKVIDSGSIEVVDSITTGKNHDWLERRRLLLNGLLPIYTKKEDILRGAKNNEFSLCLFKPNQIEYFYAENDSEEYSARDLARIRKHQEQGVLFDFDDQIPPKNLTFKKIPYTFHCRFRDDTGAVMNLSVLDWEMSSLYRSCMTRERQKEKAKAKTLQKYEDFIKTRDVYFVLGTRNDDHNKLINSKNPNCHINPWSIISVIPFAKQIQMELNL